MHLSQKIFIKVLLLILSAGVFAVGFLIATDVPWTPDVQFDIEGRLGNMKVQKDSLLIECSKGQQIIKNPATIYQLAKLLPAITERCGKNANAMLLFGTEKKAYDVLVRTSSKFAPGKLLVLRQDLIQENKAAEMILAVYDESTYAKEYEKNLGTVPSFLREGDWGLEFKDFNEDGKIEARVRAEFPADTGYLTLHYQNGKYHAWKHPGRNMHYGFIFRDDALYCSDTPRPDIDLSSFTLFNSSWAKDAYHLYRYECEPYDAGFDLPSFEVVSENGVFVKDKNGVWFEGYLGYAGLTGHNQVEGADPSSYVYMGDGIGKDKYHVYNYVYPDEEYPGVDVATLVGAVESERGGLWMKDKNQVYWRGKVAEAANPTTFEVISTKWGRDGNKLYYTYQYIPTGDPDTLQDIDGEISSAYQKDKNNIYYSEGGFNGPIVVNADHATYRPISDRYAKDKFRVFSYGNNIIEGADPETFVDLNDYGYAKDKNHVYLSGHIVEGEDPATFTVEN